MTFEQRLAATAVIGLAGALMIFARRYNNKPSSDAGYAIAGWSMALIIFGVWGD